MSSYSSIVGELLNSLDWTTDARSFGQQSIELMNAMRTAGMNDDPISQYECDYMLAHVQRYQDPEIPPAVRAMATNLEAFLEEYKSIVG